MLPIEIHDRGRGPELKGTRITVYDIIPYRLGGCTPAGIADILRPGYPAITPAHIEAFRAAPEPPPPAHPEHGERRRAP